MKRRPTYQSLAPVEGGGFSLAQRRDDMRRNAYAAQPTEPVPAHFDVRTLVSQQAVAAIRTAFTQAKTSHKSWKSNQRVGRFDVRQAPRIQNGAQDVFKRKVGRSTTNVRVGVLIDASGSMNSGSMRIPHPGDPKRSVQVTRTMAAALFGATIATALGRVPTIALDIFQHAAGGNTLTLKYRWTRGTPVAVFNEAAVGHIGAGGNADGHALFAITERLRRELKRDEKGIILVVSDGLPSDYSPTGTANVDRELDGLKDAYGTPLTAPALKWRKQQLQAGQALVDAVAHARRNGIEVIAVAIEGSDQSAYYGKDNMIQFRGDWTDLGKALGQHVGAALAAR